MGYVRTKALYFQVCSSGAHLTHCVASSSDGTPGGQTAAEQFDMDWPTALVSSFGAIVVRCDGRGSGFQGTNLLHRVQKRLGVFEEQDQRDALR